MLELMMISLARYLYGCAHQPLGDYYSFGDPNVTAYRLRIGQLDFFHGHEPNPQFYLLSSEERALD